MDDNEETGLLLDPDYRYDYKEIDKYLSRDGVGTVWESHMVIDEGVLALGEFFVRLDGPKKWLHAWEQYLNEWSSCMRVEYLDEIPQELWDAAEKYNEELDRAFEERKRKQQEEFSDDKALQPNT